ncbi:mono-functional DNA-alkylating methyl methanesulfonate N-term-domain-containing protein [Dactylonectria estremocensis]|uniref:Mono-functional DNA-alkylating methyl methanesulfonate N-term-domain-containing protein n=1 Tax=Dactylonectria estremocensis TaxID=1079267 RepID=A0A9P9EGN0_9HYPO|nr:mono-functional DNA-alkylating methyl methanesulfonate N-term-domain-containing protein [Dactylonectria estremocensis]
MQDATKPHGAERLPSLPPQMLVLVLENGDGVFMFIRERTDRSLEFITTKYKNPTGLAYLGYHLCMSPTSSYMVTGSIQSAFVVYELESLKELNAQYMLKGSFNPVRSIRLRQFRGSILHMKFLHPRPQDQFHIIVLLLIARMEGPNGLPSTRMIYWEWELGDELKTVFATEKSGARLPEEHQVPLLLIPLRFNSAFCIVSEHCIGIVNCALDDPHSFETLHNNPPSQTELHHGAAGPLWTAWARPFRRQKYFENTDIIYLAREDGVLVHIEIEASGMMPQVTNVGAVGTNISTAFTTAYDVFADVFVIGGNSGPGGIWKLPARGDLTQVSTIPNWSPVIDLATTDEYSSWAAGDLGSGNTPERSTESIVLKKPDRIFCTSGRGPNSGLTELRWGIQARIGLEFDYGQPIRQSWMFPVDIRGDMGFYALLSLPYSSDVLHLSSDLTNANALSPDACPFDTTSRTIHAVQNEHGSIVQITEVSVTLVAPSQSSRHRHADLLGSGDATAENAFCKDGLVVISTHKDQGSELHVLEIDQMNLSTAKPWDARGEVTCISMFSCSEQTLIVSGSVMDGSLWISIYLPDGSMVVSEALSSHKGVDGGASNGQMEAFTSVSVLTEGVNGVVLAFGTRSGHLVTGRVAQQDSTQISISVERLGMAPVNVFSASRFFGGEAAVFACCDNNLIIMTSFSQRHTKFQTKNSIWPTDSKDPSMPSPPINSVHCLEQSLSAFSGHMSLMMLAGSRVLLAEMWPHVGSVTRSIPLEGTPLRVMYSPTWKCLIVAHLKHNFSTLSFVDPDTGIFMSTPTDKNLVPRAQISGLSLPGDKVFGLGEWHYVKDGKTFPFLLVTTQMGMLLVVSIVNEEIETDNGKTRHIRYWTRHKKRVYQGSISAVAGDPAGLLFSVGSVLHWEVLDVLEKKLKPSKLFQLDSPAVTLQIKNGKACALTTHHSLQVIDMHMESETLDMSLIHSDEVTRFIWHSIELGDSAEHPGQWPVNFVSARDGGIVGLWVPWGRRNQELGRVFEGQLARPVMKFRRGHTRPLWLSVDRERRYNSLLSTADGAEILGVSLDGSLQHFSLIGVDLWRFLRLVQNLAQASSTISPFTHVISYQNGNVVEKELDMDMDMGMEIDLEAQQYPEMMHIDGDVLQQCLDLGALKKLTAFGDGLDLFCEYLDGIADGAYTEGFRDDMEDGQERYLTLGYDILEYVLAPVL